LETIEGLALSQVPGCGDNDEDRPLTDTSLL